MQSSSFLISCPACHHQFSMSDELQKSMQSDFEKTLHSALEKKEQEHEKKIQEEKQRLWAIAQQKADEKIKIEYDTKMKIILDQKEQFQKQWEESQKKEIAFLKKEADLEQKQKMMEWEMQKQVLEAQKLAKEIAQKEFEEAHRLKDLEKEKQLEQMRKTIDELKRKSEQGSMQIQGDVQENDLKETLLLQFPIDEVVDVATGKRGADLMQIVKTPFGKEAGKIIWESKNTKHWEEKWIAKLKEDQATARADIAIIATQVLPENIEHYAYRNGVWVVQYQYALSLASILRFHLIEMEKTKGSLLGQDEKMQMIFSYISSPQFKNRIENIIDAFTKMKDELEKEKRGMQAIWNRREKELERVMLNTSGVYGDFQGLLGSGMQTIKKLDLFGDGE